MGPEEMRQVASFISRTFDSAEDEAALEGIRREVEDMADGFPVPGITDRAPVRA